MVAGIDKIRALGSLDIDKLDVIILLEFFPIDASLVLGDINAVKLYVGGIDGRGGLGLGRCGSFGRVVLGMSGPGVDIYVPESLYSDAKELSKGDSNYEEL